MLPLLVRISNSQTGEVEHKAFASSPVRIGRNQLNELVLNEPFVSQWHAVVRFDEHKMRYIDLGSTNGTMLNGRRVARHMQIEVNPQVDLRIGPLQLTFARANVTPDMYAAPRTTMFHLGTQLNEAGGSAVTGATIAFNMSDPATLHHATMLMQPGGALPDPATQSTLPGGINVTQLVAVAEQLRPLYEQYRRSWEQVLAEAKSQMEGIPSEQRTGVLLALCQQYPQLQKEPEFRAMTESLGVDPAALGEVDAAVWIRRLGADGQVPAGSQVNTALAMERVGGILESFGQAYVELRKGYEQFGEEMGLSLVQERSPLHDAQSAEELMRYLLDWTTDGSARVRELTRAFADLALHQVALLSGVVEGVRAILQGLSPAQLAGERNHALARQAGGGFLERIFNARKARLWRAFVDGHERLIEEDRFSREIFGRAFARAYFMVSGGHVSGEESDGVAVEPGAGAHPPQ